MTQPPEIRRVYVAKEFDVMERIKEIERWENLPEEKKLILPEPSQIHIGENIQKTIKPKSASVFWTKGIIVHDDGTLEGQGLFNIEMLLYQKLGLKLERYPNALIETLRLPFRIFLPILLIILVSLFTSAPEGEKAKRFFAKMKVPVNLDPDKDRQNIDDAYKNRKDFEHLKIFPNTNFEFQNLTREDVIGFLVTWGMVLVVIWLASAIASIGS